MEVAQSRRKISQCGTDKLSSRQVGCDYSSSQQQTNKKLVTIIYDIFVFRTHKTLSRNVEGKLRPNYK